MAEPAIEQLQEMTRGYKRKRSAPQVDPTDRIEQEYAAELRNLVRAMARAVESQVIPSVKEEKEAYRSVDSFPSGGVKIPGVETRDSWSDKILNALRNAKQAFSGEGFEQKARRVAQNMVGLADREATSSLVRSVNQSVGVDLTPVLSQGDMRDYVNAAAHQNAELIKSVPQEYFKRIEEAVVGGVRGGDSPSQITRKIQQATGISQRRARFIARDQTSKLTGEINERRQKQAGIKYFRWETARDQRVGDDHRAASRRDIGYGPGVYKWDKPPDEGIPGKSVRPNCRCTATPIFEWEIESGQTKERPPLNPDIDVRQSIIKSGRLSKSKWNKLSKSRRATVNRSLGRANPPKEIKELRRQEIKKRLNANTEKQKRKWLNQYRDKLPLDEEGRKRRLLDNWVRGSKRKVSVEMKQAAIEEFDSGGIPYSRRDYKMDQSLVQETRRDLRKVYNETQEQFRKKGVTHVTLYRGLKTDVSTPGALASWTTDRKIAESFNGGRVMKKRVPVDKVLTGRGMPSWEDGPFGDQKEFVVIGGG